MQALPHKEHTEKPAIGAWLVLLIAVNASLLYADTPATGLMFSVADIGDGQWWRILTWPFVHVSRYHLLLDGCAFLLLYSGLEASGKTRAFYFFGAAFGSLLLPLAVSPEIIETGLCGLSGPAHGLLGIQALELSAKPRNRKLGLFLLFGLLGKCGWELATGQVFLQGVHLGDIGHPVVATHAGGVLGSIVAFAGKGVAACATKTRAA